MRDAEELGRLGDHLLAPARRRPPVSAGGPPVSTGNPGSPRSVASGAGPAHAANLASAACSRRRCPAGTAPRRAPSAPDRPGPRSHRSSGSSRGGALARDQIWIPGNVRASIGTNGIDPPEPISSTSAPKASPSAAFATNDAGAAGSTMYPAPGVPGCTVTRPPPGRRVIGRSSWRAPRRLRGPVGGHHGGGAWARSGSRPRPRVAPRRRGRRWTAVTRPISDGARPEQADLGNTRDSSLNCFSVSGCPATRRRGAPDVTSLRRRATSRSCGRAPSRRPAADRRRSRCAGRSAGPGP